MKKTNRNTNMKSVFGFLSPIYDCVKSVEIRYRDEGFMYPHRGGDTRMPFKTNIQDWYFDFYKLEPIIITIDPCNKPEDTITAILCHVLKKELPVTCKCQVKQDRQEQPNRHWSFDDVEPRPYRGLLSDLNIRLLNQLYPRFQSCGFLDDALMRTSLQFANAAQDAAMKACMKPCDKQPKAGGSLGEALRQTYKAADAIAAGKMLVRKNFAKVHWPTLDAWIEAKVSVLSNPRFVAGSNGVICYNDTVFVSFYSLHELIAEAEKRKQEAEAKEKQEAKEKEEAEVKEKQAMARLEESITCMRKSYPKNAWAFAEEQMRKIASEYPDSHFLYGDTAIYVRSANGVFVGNILLNSYIDEAERQKVIQKAKDVLAVKIKDNKGNKHISKERLSTLLTCVEGYKQPKVVERDGIIAVYEGAGPEPTILY